MSSFHLVPLLPELFMAMIAMGLLMVGVFRGNESTAVVSWAAVASVAVALLLALGLSWERQIVMNGMFVMDQFAGIMKLLIFIGLGVSLALSVRYLYEQNMARFEYPILVLFAGLGMLVMVSANNMLSLYMGLELQSLSLYVLAAFQRNTPRSAEAGLKYFVLGALSSGILLFGISLIYGYTGSLDFDVIRQTLADAETVPVGATIGLVFVLAGLAFKISAAPFHMWTPDVYQGAPSCVTALFAIVPKLAAMAMLMRLIFVPFGPLADQWVQILYFLSIASMAVGAFGAITQTNIKRLMAYSSIGHMGYALIGLIAGGPQGAGAVIAYLMIYLVMSCGVFGILLSMNRDGRNVEGIIDLAGLSRNSPVMAYCMAILMFSMSGIPPMAGFFGKLVIFDAAVTQGHYILAVLGVLSSVVAAYYYLRIVKVMFFDEPTDAFDREVPFARRAVIAISVAFVLVFVLQPNLFINSALKASSALFTG